MNETVRCTNCGEDIKDDPRGCAMFDRCVPSQNDEINNALGDKVYQLLAEGKKVYADTGRPLCRHCYMTNGGICCHCELDRSLEEGGSHES
jgi:hypothetical protein